MDIPESVTVAALVKTKAEAAAGFVVELEIADFKSQYPTKCTRVHAEVAAALSVGKLQNVTLKRQALKKNSQGEPRSGQYYSDYYWGLTAVVLHDDAPPPPPPPPVPDVRPMPPERDEVRLSIEAQTAYNGAVRLLAAWGVGGKESLIEMTVIGMRAIQAAKADQGKEPLPRLVQGIAKSPAKPVSPAPAAAAPVQQAEIVVGRAVPKPAPGNVKVQSGLDIQTPAGEQAPPIEDLFPPDEDPATVAGEKAQADMKAQQIQAVIALAKQKGVSGEDLDARIKRGYKGRLLGELNWTEMEAVKKALAKLPDVA